MNNNPRLTDQLAISLSEVVRQHLYNSTKTCLRCSHFREQSEYCIKFGVKPQARIIAFGCTEFDEEIPF